MNPTRFHSRGSDPKSNQQMKRSSLEAVQLRMYGNPRRVSDAVSPSRLKMNPETRSSWCVSLRVSPQTLCFNFLTCSLLVRTAEKKKKKNQNKLKTEEPKRDQEIRNVKAVPWGGGVIWGGRVGRAAGWGLVASGLIQDFFFFSEPKQDGYGKKLQATFKKAV